MLNNEEAHLKPAYAPDWEARIKNTYPGMASWGGQAPGFSCAQCRHYIKHPRKPYGDGSCQKARDMGVDSKNTVPKNAPACKYFEPIGIISHRPTSAQSQIQFSGAGE